MTISVVFGFFLPVPAVRGGATERSWHGLARRFAAAGHRVVAISRRWPGQADREMADGIEFRRVPGAPHSSRLAMNLVRDFRWSVRAAGALPRGEAVISHSVALPVWLPRLAPSRGKVIPVIGRMPKGQVRRYGGAARLYAGSRSVAEAAERENPALRDRIKVVWYPIDWELHRAAGASRPISPELAAPVAIGFAGRLHPEKGLELLLRAAGRLAADPSLPPWRLDLVGPAAVPEGGGGDDWLARLVAAAGPALGARLQVLPPQFDPPRLAAHYAAWDLFCYPSLAERGETFGVAVAEAMASGCAPVVSALDCFRDLVDDGETGLVFDHRGPGAEERLAGALARLIAEAALRRRIGAAAQQYVRRFDYAEVAANILADLGRLS